MPLRTAEEISHSDLEKDIKILAAAAYLDDDPQATARKRYLVMLTYLLALLNQTFSTYSYLYSSDFLKQKD